MSLGDCRVRSASHLHDWLESSWHINETLTLRPLDSHYSGLCRQKKSKSGRSRSDSSSRAGRVPKHASEGNRFITDAML